MSTIEIRKADKTATLLRAELARMNDDAANASIAHYAYCGTDPTTQRDEDAAIEAAVYMRYTYALYVAKGEPALAALHTFAIRANVSAKPLIMLAYLNIEVALTA